MTTTAIDVEYVDDVDIEPPFVTLMDTLAFDTVPSARQLIELLKQRGWTGWCVLRGPDFCFTTVHGAEQSHCQRAGRSAGSDLVGGVRQSDQVQLSCRGWSWDRVCAKRWPVGSAPSRPGNEGDAGDLPG
jgi:hypothetical protein